MGLFVTFEGGEGSGKSTQVQALSRRLTDQGIATTVTREPGGTILGNQIREWLGQTQNDVATQLLLFAASRAVLVRHIIRPALEEGQVVICDRFSDSTLVYQGYAGGLDLNLVRAVNDLATEGLKPELTILLDTPPGVGLGRRQATLWEHFEQQELVFHEKVRQGYLELAKAEPGRWLVIDGTLPQKQIEHIIWRKVQELLENQNILRKRDK